MSQQRSDQRTGPALRRASDFLAVAKAQGDSTILDVMMRGRWWLAMGLVLGLACSALYLKLATPIYESTAEVYVARKENLRDNSPLDKPALSSASPQTHGELIRTTEVLATALRMRAVAESQTLAGHNQPLPALRNLLRIESDPKAEIVRVTVESPYPEEAAMLTNSIVAAYLRLQKQRSQIGGWNLVAGQDAASFAHDANLAPAAELLIDMQDDSEAVSTTVIAAQMSRLGEALTQAEIAVADAEVRYRTAIESGDDLDRLFPLASTVLGTANDLEGLAGVRLMQNELAQLRRLIDDLPPSWGDQHPRRQELIARFTEVRRRYNDSRHAVAQGLRDLLQQKLEQSRNHQEEIRRALDEQHVLAARATRLPVAVIEPAQVPLKPARPQRTRVLALGGVLGVMLGVLLAFVQDMRVSHQVVAATKSAAAAATSQIKTVLTVIAPGRTEELPATLDDLPVLGAVPTVASSSRLAISSPVLDDGASSIHQIRAILQLRAMQHGQKSFAFTSPQRGAGRTSVLVGLGTSLAISGTRTLLVDCDLASRISRGGGQAPGPKAAAPAKHPTVDGLLMDIGCVGQNESQALTTRTSIKIGIAGMLDGGSLQQCAIPASVPNLTLLPAVFATPLHIGKLSPAFVERLIREAADHFDLILFDTGPIPGSVEALLVTAKCDGVVAIIPPGQSQAGYDKMRSYLKMINAHILGVIFNRTTGDTVVGDSDLENLGSGVLAAAVFSDASSAYAKDDLDMDGLGDVTAGITGPSAQPPHRNGDTAHDWSTDSIKVVREDARVS
jgi:succinoglycan biosynthesis transport protein ExoP